jgi:hypothetical protein
MATVAIAAVLVALARNPDAGLDAMNDDLRELKDCLESVASSLREVIESYLQMIAIADGECRRLQHGVMTELEVDEFQLHAESIALYRRFIAHTQRRLVDCEASLDDVNASLRDRTVCPPVWNQSPRPGRDSEPPAAERTPFSCLVTGEKSWFGPLEAVGRVVVDGLADQVACANADQSATGCAAASTWFTHPLSPNRSMTGSGSGANGVGGKIDAQRTWLTFSTSRWDGSAFPTS